MTLRSRRLLALFTALAALLTGCATSPAPAPTPSPSAAREIVAYEGGTVVTSPDTAPIPEGVVLTDGARIVAVGSRSAVAIPPGARVVDCRGTTVLAAFWNAHVHFTERTWADAAQAPAPRLEEGLRAMLTRWGFAHAFDTGSNIRDTGALRTRIESGEIRGPEIRTTGGVYVARGGQPAYIPFPLPQLGTPAEGRAAVNAELDHGADAVKLMTASVVAAPPSPVMPVEVVRAVTEAAHARGALVFAHPTNHAGVLAARDGGVDILAHTAPATGPWSDDDARALVARGVSLVPTLSLWRREIEPHDPAVAARYEEDAVQQARAFAAAGGTLLFGTDVGYRAEYDTTPEHELLARAGLSFAARLAMLTTAPATRFHAARSGRLEVGLDADLVVLEGDPRRAAAAFAHVRCTVRRGVTLYSARVGACGER